MSSRGEQRVGFRMRLLRRYRFEAAHRLPAVPADHKCFRLHGHSYGVVVYVEGDVEADTGMVIEFAELDAVVEPLLRDELDHRYLNDLPGLENPTAEHLAQWLWRRLQNKLPMLKAVEVQETANCAVVYEGRD